MPLTCLHHVSLVCADASRSLPFYTRVLGLRLVKQTVRTFDPSAYHLYFGDALGRPGTLISVFEWPTLEPGLRGVGGVHHVALAVRGRDELRRWKRRLNDLGFATEGPYDRVYFESLYLRDPDGVIVELATQGPGWTVDEAPNSLGMRAMKPPAHLARAGRDEAAIGADTWATPVGAIDPAMAITGLHHVTAICTDIDRTGDFFLRLLDLKLCKRSFNFDNPATPHWYMGAGDGSPGGVVTYFGEKKGRRSRIGPGLTHHITFCCSADDELEYFRERLGKAGISAAPPIDNGYYRSISFQGPDGELLEIATPGPGFTTDEPPDDLGYALRLPADLEQDRPRIVSRLKRLTT